MPFIRHLWPIVGTKCIQSEFCLGFFTTLNWWLSLSVIWASSPFTPAPWQKWLLILTYFPTFASSYSYKFPLFSSSSSSLPSKMTTCDSDGVAQTQGTGRRQKLASVTQTIGPRRLAKLFKWKLFSICKVPDTVLLSQSTSIAETKMINTNDFILLACRLLVNKPFSYVPLPVSRNLLGAWTFACFFSNCCTWPKVLTFPRSLSTLLSQAIGRSELLRLSMTLDSKTHDDSALWKLWPACERKGLSGFLASGQLQYSCWYDEDWKLFRLIWKILMVTRPSVRYHGRF